MKIKFNVPYLAKSGWDAYIVLPTKKGYDKLLGRERIYGECYRVKDGNHYGPHPFSAENFIAELEHSVWDELTKLHDAYHDKMAADLDSIIRENIDKLT